MYLLILITGMLLSYFLVAIVISQLMQLRLKASPKRTTVSLVIVIFLTIFFYYISIYLYSYDKSLSNRFLHAFDGAFNVVILLFLVKRDFKLTLTKIQFVILTVLVVSFLGIVNEILEYFMQTYFDYFYSVTPVDTWLDLISNLTGTILGIFCVFPFINTSKHVKYHSE